MKVKDAISEIIDYEQDFEMYLNDLPGVIPERIGLCPRSATVVKVDDKNIIVKLSEAIMFEDFNELDADYTVRFSTWMVYTDNHPRIKQAIKKFKEITA